MLVCAKRSIVRVGILEDIRFCVSAPDVGFTTALLAWDVRLADYRHNFHYLAADQPAVQLPTRGLRRIRPTLHAQGQARASTCNQAAATGYHRITLAKRSGEGVLDDFAVDVGEAEVTALILERQSFVVDAQQVQQRGVEVVHVDALLDDVVAVVVRAPHDGTALGAAAGHPK